MLEQELASIAKAVLLGGGSPKPYYNVMLDSFQVPSIFFPPVEVSSSNFSLGSYRVNYTWRIKAFGRDAEQAYGVARPVMENILKSRGVIPLFNLDGSPSSGCVRLKTPSIKALDGAAYQILLEWNIIRSYEQEAVSKMQVFQVEFKGKQEG